MDHKHLDNAALERLLAIDRTAEQNELLSTCCLSAPAAERPEVGCSSFTRTTPSLSASA